MHIRSARDSLRVPEALEGGVLDRPLRRVKDVGSSRCDKAIVIDELRGQRQRQLYACKQSGTTLVHLDDVSESVDLAELVILLGRQRIALLVFGRGVHLVLLHLLGVLIEAWIAFEVT